MRGAGSWASIGRALARVAGGLGLVAASVAFCASGAGADDSGNGTVAGTITYPAGDQASGTCLDLWSSGNETKEGPFTTSFSVSVPAGSYTVEVDTTCTYPYSIPDWSGPASQWYTGTAGGTGDQSQAATVPVAAGATSAVDVTLQPSGHISGVVTLPPPSPTYEGPWAAMLIQAFTADGTWDGYIGDVQSSSNNSYSYVLGDLSAGPHSVEVFWQCNAITNCPPGHILWYPGVSDQAGARLVNVNAGGTTTGIDMSFAPSTPSPTTTVAPPALRSTTGPTGAGTPPTAGGSVRPAATAPAPTATTTPWTTAPSTTTAPAAAPTATGTPLSRVGAVRTAEGHFVLPVGVRPSGPPGWLWLLLLPVLGALGWVGATVRRRRRVAPPG
jgi:hypothetical protein